MVENISAYIEKCNLIQSEILHHINIEEQKGNFDVVTYYQAYVDTYKRVEICMMMVV